METSSLAVQTQPMPRSLLQMSDSQMNKLMLLADMISQSKLAIGKNGRETLTKADAFMILLKGISLGMNEMAALESIDLISGKPAVDGQGMLGLCYASDELEDIQIVATNEKCSVTMKRKGKTPHTEVFGVEEASRYMTSEWSNGSKKTIPLIEKDNYKSQPRTMFKWRAIAACARIVFPDKVQGLYTKEELGANVAVTEDGAMVVQEQPALPTPKPQPAPQVQIAATVTKVDTSEQQKVEPTPEPPPATNQPYKEHELWNAVLKDTYNNNAFHMKASIKKLIEAGTLKPEMTLTQAIAVVKGRKTEDNLPVTLPPDVAAAKATEPVKDAAYYAEQERLDREAAKTALNNETVTIYKVTYKPSRNGQGLPKWEALAHDINKTSLPVVLWGEDVAFLEKAGGYKLPATDAVDLKIPVMTKLQGKDRRITDVMALDGSWVPFKKGEKVADNSQQMFNDLPGKSKQLENQLEEA